MATFVLVHGAFHGAWCYTRVATRLRAEGHDVFVPILSGVGENAHLAHASINLSTHIEDVLAEITANGLSDIILCGHSYGGLVIAGVATKISDRIRSLFYLDGCVPEDGQSLFDLVGAEGTFAFLQGAGTVGWLLQPMGSAFFHVNQQDCEMVDRLCTPHPVACFIEKVRLSGEESRVPRRTYVRCDEYQSINYPTYARLEGLGNWKVTSLGCGHDAMLDAPDAVARLLLEEV